MTLTAKQELKLIPENQKVEFLKCAMEANDSIINLNTIMKKIKVKKRRIYDITNVLEGKSII